MANADLPRMVPIDPRRHFLADTGSARAAAEACANRKGGSRHTLQRAAPLPPRPIDSLSSVFPLRRPAGALAGPGPRHLVLGGWCSPGSCAASLRPALHTEEASRTFAGFA